MNPVHVTLICNPSYSGGRDQEDPGDGGLKSAWANNSRDPISEVPNTEKGLAGWLKWYSACLANVKP
jgi:hypothetical protein